MVATTAGSQEACLAETRASWPASDWGAGGGAGGVGE